MTYTGMELMICAAAHELEDNRTAAVGTGLPCAAAMLAQRTHAPNLVIAFEAGGFSPQLPTMPISVGDSTTFHRGLMATSMSDIMQFCQRGMFDYTFLGGAQIDMYGNLNSTFIGGTYTKPKVRLPGSGGANDLASFCWKTLIIMHHDKKKFAAKLDFLTTPGYLTGPGARESAGLPANTGPHRVISDLGVFDFDAESKRMRVRSIHPGKTLDDIVNATSFELLQSDSIVTTPAPNERELHILRTEVDPGRYMLGKSV